LHAGSLSQTTRPPRLPLIIPLWRVGPGKDMAKPMAGSGHANGPQSVA
jgi:hypothetical protein